MFVQFWINSTRDVWKCFQIGLALFVYYLHDKISKPQRKTFQALDPALLEDNFHCQHHILCLN